MKKIITLLIVMGLLGLFLSGCASVEVETPEEENQSFDFSQCEVFGQSLSVGEDQMLCCEVHAKN